MKPRPCAFQLLKAAGIGAGVVVTFLTVIWFIYALVKCLCLPGGKKSPTGKITRETTVMSINIQNHPSGKLDAWEK